MTALQHEGLEIDLLPGWEGRIFTRQPEGASDSRTQRVPAQDSRPVLHLGTFELPVEIGDYGGGAVELMGANDAFVALIDFGPDAADTPLFAGREIPRPLRTTEFSPSVLQRGLHGQSGTQRFFTVAHRGFCLYVVLGAHLMRPRLVPAVNDALRSLRIS